MILKQETTLSETLVPFTEGLMFVVRNEQIGRQVELKFTCEHCQTKQIFPKGSSNPAISCYRCDELNYVEGFYITVGTDLT